MTFIQHSIAGRKCGQRHYRKIVFINTRTYGRRSTFIPNGWRWLARPCDLERWRHITRADWFGGLGGVAQMIRLSNQPDRKLVKKFGCVPSAIWNVRHGLTWREVRA